MSKSTENLMPLVNKQVDKVYVLSVKTFTERIAHIKNLMLTHGIEFQFIFDYDIPELDTKTLDKTFDSSCQLSMAQKSLVLKHIGAWQDAALNHFQRVLIFEDDVILNKNFDHYFDSVIEAANQLPPDYLIFLGGADTKVPEHFLLSEETLVALPIATAEAYITDIVAIKRRLDWLAENKVLLPADHLICAMDKIANAANYWSRRPMAEQGSVTGIFRSHLDSHRQKHSKLFNTLRYRWNKFQRHILRRWLAKLRSKLNQR